MVGGADMYKILLKRSERGVKSLYEYSTKLVINTETNNTMEVVEEFENEDTLRDRVRELLLTRSINDFSVVADKTYEVDVLFSLPNDNETEEIEP